MSTPFDKLMDRLKAAEGDPSKLALVNFDIAVEHDAALKTAAEAAAIPHWFDAKTLAALLPEHEGEIDSLLEQIKALPMVEPYSQLGGEPAWNVHEATRLALRNRLLAVDSERFRQLSSLAAAAYGQADPHTDDFRLTCEHIYHTLASQSDVGEYEMAEVVDVWLGRSRIEPVQTLARFLEELLDSEPAVCLLPYIEGLAHIVIADARKGYQPACLTQTSLQKAEAIFRSLADSNPTNAQWQRDLSLSLDRLGNLAVARGDPVAATASYTQSKIITELLAASDPANTEWQRDISISLHKLGDLAAAQGDVAAATASYTQGKTIIERLIVNDPANTEWQRDFSISLNKFGELAIDQGDMTGALQAFTQSKAIREELLARDPSNAQLQHDLIILHERMGEVALDQGDIEQAIIHFENSRTGWSTLINQDPANMSYQRGIVVPLGKLGTVAVTQGDLTEALQAFTQTNLIAERLTDSDPSNANWQRDLWVSCWRLADLCEKSNQPDEAQSWRRKTHDTLAGMKERGLYVSPQDEKFLEYLKTKLADDKSAVGEAETDG